MESFLRIALPTYFLCYIVFLVAVRSWSVSLKIGKSPVVLATGDDIHGLISNYFKLIGACLTFYLLFTAISPESRQIFLPLEFLEHRKIQIAGLALLVLSFVIVFVAQLHMRNSFRIGIDQGTQTDLVTEGLFRFSRNPIYVGMLASIVGLFLVRPDAFTLLLTIVAFVLIQVQVRLEEDYLLKIHGGNFIAYKKRVRRFL